MLNTIERKNKWFRGLRLHLALFLVALFLFQGCAYKRNHILFQSEKMLLRHGFTLVHIPGDTNRALAPAQYEHHVKVGDRISVKFLNNYDISTGITIAGGGSTDEVTFLVDANGEVVLPMVGRVQINGMTRKEIGIKLENLYSASFKEPRIEVQFVGMKVSLLGEVLTPGVYLIEDEDIDLVSVIAKAGGITSSGKANSVRVIRSFPEVDSTVMFVMDMTNVDILNENELILHDNDIVVVEPTNIRAVSQAIQPYAGLLTLFSTLSSLTFLVIALFRPASTTP